jgi:hypothetical protein
MSVFLTDIPKEFTHGRATPGDGPTQSGAEEATDAVENSAPQVVNHADRPVGFFVINRVAPVR